MQRETPITQILSDPATNAFFLAAKLGAKSDAETARFLASPNAACAVPLKAL